MAETLDLSGKLPAKCSRHAAFCHKVIANMRANTYPLPGERDADVYAARFTRDTDTGDWSVDVLFKLRHRTGKIRNHRLILTVAGDDTATATVDDRRVDLTAALHPFRSTAPHKSQYPSIFAKHFIRHAG